MHGGELPDPQEIRERALTGGVRLRRLLITTYVVIGLTLINQALDFDLTHAVWFDEGDQALYCFVVNDADSSFPPAEVVMHWFVSSTSSLKVSCRHHNPENISADVYLDAESTTRLGVTRVHVEHGFPEDPGCVFITGGMLNRIELQACVDNDG